MTLILAHAALAWLWMALTERYTTTSFLTGLAVAHAALWFSRRAGWPIRKAGAAVRFAGFFAREVVVSAVRVAADALAPRPRMRPAIVAVPLEVRTDAQITALAILVTLTPGTLALDVTPDRRALLVHAMYASDPDAVARDLKVGFERRVLELTEGSP